MRSREHFGTLKMGDVAISVVFIVFVGPLERRARLPDKLEVAQCSGLKSLDARVDSIEVAQCRKLCNLRCISCYSSLCILVHGAVTRGPPPLEQIPPGFGPNGGCHQGGLSTWTPPFMAG